MKTLKYMAGSLLGLCSLAQAGDLVLNLGSSEYRIPLSSSTNIQISPVTNDIIARPFVTSGQAGDGWCPAGSGGTPATVSFNQSTTLIQPPPGNVTLSWTTGNVTQSTCATSVTFNGSSSTVAGWGTSVAANGSSSATISLSTVGTWVFTLSCVGATGTVQQSKTVSVQNSVVTTDCTGHEPPAGMTRLNSFINSAEIRAGGNTEWATSNTTLSTTSWRPEPTNPPNSSAPSRSVLGNFAANPGDTALIPIPTTHYVAFAIDTTGITGKSGQVSSEQPGQNAAPFFITISPCPGDPNPAEPRCKGPYGLSALGWTLRSDPTTYCPLQTGKIYYLNAFFRRPDELNVTDCPTGTCWWFMHQSCDNSCPQN